MHDSIRLSIARHVLRDFCPVPAMRTCEAKAARAQAGAPLVCLADFVSFFLALRRLASNCRSQSLSLTDRLGLFIYLFTDRLVLCSTERSMSFTLRYTASSCEVA